MVTVFEGKIAELTDKHCPTRSIRIRSNEKPWITNGIRRRSRKKKRLYKREGRSLAWRRAEGKLAEEIAQRKLEFVEETINSPDKNFYAAAKKLGGPGSAIKQWGVGDLFPSEEVESAGKTVLDYFSSVGGDDPPSDIPDVTHGEAGLGTFDATRVESLLRANKKVKSRVDGDPLPHLVWKFPKAFSTPIAVIFEAINNTARWPLKWKEKHLTIIPKCPKPNDLSECRNISCTPLMSKVLEGVVLEKLRGELTLDPEQFGGIKGCGAEHMIVEIWDRVLRALDNGDAAACLLGVDFEKAFNRMDHGHCIWKLKRLGASEESLRLVKFFLSDRKMSLTLQGKHCGTRDIIRGSPQGSVLGCLLYCITTQHLTERAAVREYANREVPPTSNAPTLVRFDDDGADVPLNVRQPATYRFFPGSGSEGDTDEEINFWDRSTSRDAASSSSDDEGAGLLDEDAAFKYIDDTTKFSAVSLSEAIRHVTTGPTKEVVWPVALERGLHEMKTKAEDIGMRINVRKTQLLCISPNNGCCTSAMIIASGETLKLVGFTFGSEPSAGAHVVAIREDFRKKVWLLFHWREAGIKDVLLYRLYCCYIRSRIEYMSAAYHSMLHKGQAEALEKLHRYALRICFGFEREIRDVMTERGIESLADRRERRFVLKTFRNPKFAHWFPRRQEGPMSLRNRRAVQEIKSKTERRHNGPMAYLRRRANDFGLAP